MTTKTNEFQALDEASEGDPSLRLYLYKDALHDAIELLKEQLTILNENGYFVLAQALRLKIEALKKPKDDN